MSDVGEPHEDRLPDVRFSYANERTFLAWIRTALGLVTAGLAITQLLPQFHLSAGRRLVGLPLILLGIVAAVYSFFNWQANERAMRTGAQRSSSLMPRLVAIVIAAVSVTGVLLVIFSGSGK